jgi:hypothetical protein
MKTQRGSEPNNSLTLLVFSTVVLIILSGLSSSPPAQPKIIPTYKRVSKALSERDIVLNRAHKRVLEIDLVLRNAVTRTGSKKGPQQQESEE